MIARKSSPFNRVLKKLSEIHAIENIAERLELEKKFSIRRRQRLRRLAFRELMAYSGGKVIAGLYRGMTLSFDVSWGGVSNPGYVLGVYESEVQSVLMNHDWSRNSSIIDIGCANGFHAVGLARHVPEVPVHAFDIQKSAHIVTRRLAEANDVEERIQFGDEFGPELQFSVFGATPLLLIDIEGGELSLLPDILPYLSQADFLIECHDRSDGSITQKLKHLFSGSHEVIEVHREGRNIAIQPIINEWPDDDAWSAISECRHHSDGWLYCLSNAR